MSHLTQWVRYSQPKLKVIVRPIQKYTCVTNWGSFVLLQIRANVVTNWGSFIITNWGKCCYRLGQLLQTRATFITKQSSYYKLGQNYYKLTQVLQIRAVITNWGIKIIASPKLEQRVKSSRIPKAFCTSLIPVLMIGSQILKTQINHVFDKLSVTQLSCLNVIRIMQDILLTLTMFNQHWNQIKLQTHIIMFEIQRKNSLWGKNICWN